MHACTTPLLVKSSSGHEPSRGHKLTSSSQGQARHLPHLAADDRRPPGDAGGHSSCCHILPQATLWSPVLRRCSTVKFNPVSNPCVRAHPSHRQQAAHWPPEELRSLPIAIRSTGREQGEGAGSCAAGPRERGGFPPGQQALDPALAGPGPSPGSRGPRRAQQGHRSIHSQQWLRSMP